MITTEIKKCSAEAETLLYEKTEGRSYALVRCEIDSELTYLISVKDKGGSSIESFSGKYKDIEKLFLVICNEGLASYQLFDVKSDFNASLK